MGDATELSASTPVAVQRDGTKELSKTSWPSYQRLKYKVKGYFRGNLYGDGYLQFTSQPSGSYSSELYVDVGIDSVRMRSSGGVTANGVYPRSYHEKIQGNRRKVTTDGSTIQFYVQDINTPQPAGVQDSLSQFWNMQRLFQRGVWQPTVGSSYTVWLMRPEGLFQWAYQIAGQERMSVAGKGEVNTFLIKPAALGKGKTSAQMWLSPELDYLPVRIRLTMENGAYVVLQLQGVPEVR